MARLRGPVYITEGRSVCHTQREWCTPQRGAMYTTHSTPHTLESSVHHTQREGCTSHTEGSSVHTQGGVVYTTHRGKWRAPHLCLVYTAPLCVWCTLLPSVCSVLCSLLCVVYTAPLFVWCTPLPCVCGVLCSLLCVVYTAPLSVWCTLL